MHSDQTSLRAFFSRFVDLPDEAWQEVWAAGHPVQYEKKRLLLQPGQVCDRMLFLHEGAIRAYRIQDGVDLTYFFYFPDAFAFATEFSSFQTGRPTTYYLECIEPCRMTAFYKADIYRLYERHPAMQKFGRLMAEEAYLLMDRRASQFQFDSLETRYLAMLEEEPGLLQRVPQHLIATYLGVTPESLSRIKQQVTRLRR